MAGNTIGVWMRRRVLGGGRNGDNSELIFSKSAIVSTVIVFAIIECALAAGDLARNAMLHTFKLPTHWQL
jgi:hypothetical protein